jgi:Uma2 family endonuclease
MTVINEAPSKQYAVRRRWTRADCDSVERLDAFPERYELIDGEVVDKVGQNALHGTCVVRATLWLTGVFGVDFVLSQTTIEVALADQATNRPEPDVVALRRPAASYIPVPPGTDVLLVIEVADSTLSTDLGAKAGLYARAGIPEYWILDVQSRRLVVHRNAADGSYLSVTSLSEDQMVAAESSPSNRVLVATLLPAVNF